MDELTEPELIEPNDVVSERIRDAFLHHIKFGRNRSDDDSIARDTYGVRWRFIDPYEYMNRPNFYFNLRARPNGEATRVAWDPGFELGTDAAQEAAIQQRVTELWPLPFREEYRLVQGERATRVAWEERAVGRGSGGDAEDGSHQSNMRWHCSLVSPVSRLTQPCRGSLSGLIVYVREVQPLGILCGGFTEKTTTPSIADKSRVSRRKSSFLHGLGADMCQVLLHPLR